MSTEGEGRKPLDERAHNLIMNEFYKNAEYSVNVLVSFLFSDSTEETHSHRNKTEAVPRSQSHVVRRGRRHSNVGSVSRNLARDERAVRRPRHPVGTGHSVVGLEEGPPREKGKRQQPVQGTPALPSSTPEKY